MNNYSDFLPCKCDESSGAEDWSGFQSSPKCLDTLSIFLAPPWFVTSKPLSDTTLRFGSKRFRHHMTSVHFSDCQRTIEWLEVIESTRYSYTAHRVSSQNVSAEYKVLREQSMYLVFGGIQNSNSYSSGTWTTYRPSYTLSSDQQHFLLLWVRILCQIC